MLLLVFFLVEFLFIVYKSLIYLKMFSLSYSYMILSIFGSYVEDLILFLEIESVDNFYYPIDYLV